MRDKEISLKTAKLAKDKGFERFEVQDVIEIPETKDSYWPLVTLHLVQKWLREVHGIHIELIVDSWGEDTCVSEEALCYRAFIWQVGKPRPDVNDDLGVDEYEKILEIAIQEALERLPTLIKP